MQKYFLILFVVFGLPLHTLANLAIDTTIIEILDDTLPFLYYHQEVFDEPTKIVFPNLTTVNGSVYFHQNVNLLSIDLPALRFVGDYTYFYGNEDLESIRLEMLDTVHNYVVINNNISLIDLNICALKHILPAEDNDQLPFYSIENNTEAVDELPFCFSYGAPENLILSNNTLDENLPQNSSIGALTADGNYPENIFHYFLPEDNINNENFMIENDTLKSKVTFDFNLQNTYPISIGVFNQLGEFIIEEMEIIITDIEDEQIQIIEILDDTLASIYYHKENFTQKTRLVFPNLTTVQGFVYFHQNVNLLSVDMPKLTFTGDYVYYYGNTVLESINMPVLDTVYNSLSITNNNNLNTLNICSLTSILPIEAEDQIPYYNISNNTQTVDEIPHCFSLGGPENLSLSNMDILENQTPNTLIGVLTAEGNYPTNYFTYFLPEDNSTNDLFNIENDTLKSKSTFDFEIQNSYLITIGVYNQLGEFSLENFEISILDIENEGMQTIEILDDTITSIYYHQENFTQKTSLVFPNLTTVLEYAYFHQNVNLVSVDLPKLNFVGDYVYFHGNEVLETVDAPVIDTIYNYMYASNNTSLTDLNICSLSHIISEDEETEAYYYIQNNPLLNFVSTCLDSTILLFSPLDSFLQEDLILVGDFQSNTNDSITHYFNDGGFLTNENNDFKIISGQLYLSKEIEEYTEDLYTIMITSIRFDPNENTQLNERIDLPITVEIKDKIVLSATPPLATLNNLFIYPNPANSKITVLNANNEELKIFDSFGRNLHTYHLTKGTNHLHLPNLMNGLYFLVSDRGFTEKLMIQKE